MEQPTGKMRFRLTFFNEVKTSLGKVWETNCTVHLYFEMIYIYSYHEQKIYILHICTTALASDKEDLNCFCKTHTDL